VLRSFLTNAICVSLLVIATSNATCSCIHSYTRRRQIRPELTAHRIYTINTIKNLRSKHSQTQHCTHKGSCHNCNDATANTTTISMKQLHRARH
jgi:hypothetical protein